jgi:hypothetical protein
MPDGERNERAAISGRRKQRDRQQQGRERHDKRYRAPRFG